MVQLRVGAVFFVFFFRGPIFFPEFNTGTNITTQQQLMCCSFGMEYHTSYEYTTHTTDTSISTNYKGSAPRAADAARYARARCKILTECSGGRQKTLMI